MSGQWSDYTNFTISLFALLDPFSVIPYVLTSSNNNGRAVRIFAVASTVTIIVVLSISHFVGVAALEVLGTSLPSFQIGGGIILLLTGVGMLFGSSESAPQTSAESFKDTNYLAAAVSPLGIPMLAGAGTITKVVVDTHPGTGVDNDLHSIALITVVAVASGLILASSSILVKVCGNGFLSVMGRIAGLITVAVAVEMMAKGTSAHVHLFMHT